MTHSRRLSIPVTEELYQRTLGIPHGVRAEVVRTLLSHAIDAADKRGTLVYGAIIDGAYELVVKDKENKGATKRSRKTS